MATLELILGPMFSGKTSYLIGIYKKNQFCNIPVAVINHSIDTRYDPVLLSSHDQIKIPCIQSTNIMDIELEPNIEVVIINEGQFFPDLYSGVVLLLERNIKVYVGGLDGDFKQDKFGQILDLIPLCDKVTKLTSLCSVCKNGTKAIFTKRLTTEEEQVVVGSSNYIPVCRQCL
jgi:thymidine kinase